MLKHTLYIRNIYISNTKLKLAKNQAKAKQHSEADLLLFENYSLSSFTLSSKNNRRYSKKGVKSKCPCLYEAIWLVTMKMRLKMTNRSRRYTINISRPKYGHRYIKYKFYLSIMMLLCIKLLLENIWSSIHEKVKQDWGWNEKKSCL